MHQHCVSGTMSTVPTMMFLIRRANRGDARESVICVRKFALFFQFGDAASSRFGAQTALPRTAGDV
eukprot:821182-Pleurochrysis_carterae.AAC.1